MKILIIKRLFIVTIMFSCTQSIANEIRVAVASNFAHAITSISKKFEIATGYRVTLTFGSTGKHYAQIKNGAPFDVFLAADAVRPKRLEKERVGLPNSRFTYAIGKVVLWSPKANYIDSLGNVLQQRQYRYLAIANPKLAPYGKAAQEILQARKLWGNMHGHIVRGENIAQTFQFIKSGNAELGFVAFSQIKRPSQAVEGSYWEVPQVLYTPIEQQAILLKDNKTARLFLSYLQSDDALQIIHNGGYDTP